MKNKNLQELCVPPTPVNPIHFTESVRLKCQSETQMVMGRLEIILWCAAWAGVNLCAVGATVGIDLSVSSIMRPAGPMQAIVTAFAQDLQHCIFKFVLT